MLADPFTATRRVVVFEEREQFLLLAEASEDDLLIVDATGAATFEPLDVVSPPAIQIAKYRSQPGPLPIKQLAAPFTLFKLHRR